MNPRIVLILILCVTSAFRLKAADGTPAERFPLLAQLTLPKTELPLGCSIPEGQPPIKGLVNLSITTNSEAFVFVDRQLTQVVGTNIEVMYYVVYKERGELGVFGWAFKTEETARQARDKLVEEHGKRFKLWLSKKYVLCLWRDTGTTDECFNVFKDFLQKKVENFEAAAE